MEIAVVGGGISGLATAFEIQCEAERRGLEVAVRVLEATPRLGGKVDTRRVDGFAIEAGVNGWLSSRVVVDELLGRVDLNAARIVSSDVARKRYLWLERGLTELPLSPPAFLASPIVGWRAKARLLLEPFARAAPDGDESVADFVRRRLGADFLERLVDPMVTGIFAGDPEQLSLASAFPKMARLEQDYGGLFKGMLGKRRETKRAGGAAASAPGPASSGLVSLADGASQLVDALRERLAVAPELGQPIERVERHGAGWRLHRPGSPPVVAERVVLATPAYASARLLDGLDTALASELDAIPYAGVAVVALAWREEDLPSPLDGFGFLVPSSSQRDILGTLWDSSVFTGRAPAGHVLTRTMVGGVRRGELLERSEGELVALVREELARAMGIGAEPELAMCIHHPRGIPQYVVGHGPRLAHIEARAAAFPGLTLTGNALYGVALADCVARAPETAQRVLD